MKERDLLDEIAEDLKRDKMIKFVKKYGKYCLSISLSIVLSYSAYIYMNHRHISTQENLSKEYYKLSNVNSNDKHGQYHSILAKLSKNKDNIYADLAKFQSVDLLINRDRKYDTAISTLIEIIQNSTHQEVIHIAKIRAAEITMKYNLISHNSEIIKLLSDTKSDAPFAKVINLLLAQILIETGQKQEAKTILTKLNNDTLVSENIKFFANAILDTI